MIKANELRLGNLFSLWMKTRKVEEIYIDGVVFAEVGFMRLCEIEPIPLTPEMLTKCGFANDWHIKANCWYLEKDKNAGYLVLPVCDNGSELTNSPILYLHQLQNLYFALTGEELEITL